MIYIEERKCDKFRRLCHFFFIQNKNQLDANIFIFYIYMNYLNRILNESIKLYLRI